MRSKGSGEDGGNNGDQSTRWSLIVRAQGRGPDARAALDTLIRRYENSVVSLICALRHPPDRSAEDLKQAFFARAIERDQFAKLDQARGRFRGWLRQSVKFFVSSDWQRWYTEQKRSAPLTVEPVHDATPEKAYLQAFARDTVMHVLQRQRSAQKDSTRFDVLKRCLPGPEMDLPKLTLLANQLGMTPAAVAVKVFNLRSEFKALLFETVADTLALEPNDPTREREIQREIRLLRQDLCDGPHIDFVAIDD